MVASKPNLHNTLSNTEQNSGLDQCDHYAWRIIGHILRSIVLLPPQNTHRTSFHSNHQLVLSTKWYRVNSWAIGARHTLVLEDLRSRFMCFPDQEEHPQIDFMPVLANGDKMPMAMQDLSETVEYCSPAASS